MLFITNSKFSSMIFLTINNIRYFILYFISNSSNINLIYCAKKLLKNIFSVELRCRPVDQNK